MKFLRMNWQSRVGSLALFALIGCLFFSSLASSSDTQQPSDSSPERELICHTDNPADCYPKIFEATHEFQKVHKDQDLPPGLHVRLNVYTGEKEAKINDPNEKVASLEGLPLDRSVVVVDPEPANEDPIPSVPSGAPVYETAGKIKPAPPTGDDATLFQNAFAELKKGYPKRGLFGLGKSPDGEFDAALNSLADLAHDLFYGLSIMDDADALTTLTCLMSTDIVFDKDSGDAILHRSQKASAIIAAALQNNPTALEKVEESWAQLAKANCTIDGTKTALSRQLFGSVTAPETCIVENRRHPGAALLKSRLAAYSGLLKSKVIQQEFVQGDTMRNILRLLLSESTEDIAAQEKAANLVMDNFLDEDMGARLGIWPNKPRGIDCAAEVETVSADCWDYHMERLAKANKGDEEHWSSRLWNMLQTQRGVSQGKKTQPKDEL